MDPIRELLHRPRTTASDGYTSEPRRRAGLGSGWKLGLAALALAATTTALTGIPALADESAEVEKAEFRHGFQALALLAPDAVGEPLHNELASANGDTHQATSGGLMVWRKADNVPAFTDGATTWLLGPEGFQVRGNDDRFDWERDLMVAGEDLRGDGTVDDNLASHSGADDMVGGVDLRGDGTVDDGLPRHSGVDNTAGVDLRGDGTVDDNLPRHSGVDNTAGGVDLRGDGTVDDGGPSGRSSGDSGSSSGSGRSGGSDDGSSSGGGRGR